MSKTITLCSECLKPDPDIYSEDVGVGGTYYGSSYDFDSRFVHTTACCNSPQVVRVDEDELPSIKEFFERYPDKGWEDLEIELEDVEAPDRGDI